MIVINNKKKLVGDINGKVTCLNRFQPFDPSIAAASYRSLGTPCNAARNNRQ